MKHFLNLLKRNSRISFMIGFLSLTTLVYIFGFEDKRTSYEHFLMSAYSKIPFHGKSTEHATESFGFPDMASLQNHVMTLDPVLGYVPLDRLKEAIRISNPSFKSRNGSGMEWTNIPAATGGRTRAIMFDPNDSLHRKLWAGAVTGGLWYNENFSDTNSSWHPVSDLWPGMAVSCITSDPLDPKTFYVGTGEPQTAMKIYRESSGVGFGIFRSRNGGDSWEKIPSTDQFRYITDIAIKIESGRSVVYAGVVSGFYQGEQHQSKPSNGLFRSEDEGETWTQVLPDIPGVFKPYLPSDIEIASNGRIFVGTMPDQNRKGGATLFYSDSGMKDTWVKINEYAILIQQSPTFNIPGRVMLTSGLSDPNRVYGAIAAGSPGVVPEFDEYYGTFIIRSNDNGISWSACNLPDDLPPGFENYANIAWHAMTIGVDPGNPDQVFAGGLNVHKSTDGGISWTRICMGNPNPSSWNTFVHVDEHTIVFQPGSSDVMVTTNDGGVFYSSDVDHAEPSFKEINKDYNTLQFYTGAIGPDPLEDHFLGGTQDDGTLYYTGLPLSMNSMVVGGDGSFCCFDQNLNRPLIASAFYNSYFFFPDGQITQYPDFKWTGIFINPADYDYINNTLFANAVTFDKGYPGSIVVISGIPDHPAGQIVDLNTGNEVPFSTLKVSPFSQKGNTTLFLGTQSGRFYRSDHLQTNPEVTDIGSTQFPEANISGIDIGKSEQEILVTFSNYGVASVWLSMDGGSTWANKEGNLPDIPVRWGVFHPGNTRQVMLATELGVWVTEDILAPVVFWDQCVDGLPNVRTDRITIRKVDNKVLAATHGRGLFTTIFPVSVPDISNRQPTMTISPNPAAQIIRIHAGWKIDQQASISIYMQNGHCVYNNIINRDHATDDIQMNISFLREGIYILTIECGGYTAAGKLIKCSEKQKISSIQQ